MPVLVLGEGEGVSVRLSGVSGFPPRINHNSELYDDSKLESWPQGRMGARHGRYEQWDVL